MAAPWFDDLTLQLDEDFDDDEQIRGEGKCWKVAISPPAGENDVPELKCRLLIIALGNSPHLFSERFLTKTGGWKELAHVRLSKDTSEYASWESATVKRTQATVWQASDDVMIISCRQEVLPEAANCWCETVLKAVQCEEAMVWSTFPGVRFQGTECLMDSLPMLRCLATDSWQHKLAWPTLETPNMIFGCAAGVLVMCQLLQIPCAVVSLVAGHADVELEELMLWWEVLQNDCCSRFFQPLTSTPRQEAVSQLRKIVPPPSSSGNMFQ